MLSEDIRKKVELAIVKTTRFGGLGVLIPGELIVTAAHCIKWDGDIYLTLGIQHGYIEEIKTAKGQLLKVTPLAVEIVTDVAVLEALDAQVYYEEEQQFTDFCEITEPVPVCLDDFEQKKVYPVFILTHEGKWVTGMAEQSKYSLPYLRVKFAKSIEAGTSGGAVINERGELLGIMSSTIGQGNNQYDSSIPILCLSLPYWVSHKYLNFNGERSEIP